MFHVNVLTWIDTYAYACACACACVPFICLDFTCLPIVCCCEQGPVRFCDDNADWKGGNCDDYRVDAPNTKHSQCFSGEAYVACPIACGTCGDCCAAPPPMMGEAGDGDGDGDNAAAEPECYFYMRYADGSIVSGSKIKETVQLTTTATATATAAAANGGGGGGGEEVVAAVSEAAVGVFSHVDSSWEPAVRSQPTSHTDAAQEATVCTAQTSPT
jgi:hypothetical protein